MTSPAGTRGEIVVVDDDADCRDVIAAMLRSGGFEVRTFARGWEALDHVRARPPSVLVRDLLMPDLDGESLARAVREDPRCAGMAVIAVTGRPPEGDLPLAFDAYVRKPVEPEVLIDVIRVLAG